MRGSDINAGQTLTYGIQGGSADPVDADYVVLDTGYGQARVNIHTGDWTFTPDRDAVNVLGAAVDTEITYTVSDGAGVGQSVQTLHIGQDGVTETAGDDSLNGTAAAEVLVTETCRTPMTSSSRYCCRDAVTRGSTTPDVDSPQPDGNAIIDASVAQYLEKFRRLMPCRANDSINGPCMMPYPLSPDLTGKMPISHIHTPRPRG